MQKAGGSLEKGPKESLTSAFGYKSGSGLKRLAGQALKKATKSLKKEPAGAMTKWFKIKKTVANKPKPRAYLTGSLEEGGKVHLIVEVTHQRSPHYLKVIDTIQEKLEVEHITKEAALALRESLCSTFEKGIQGFEKCAATLPKTLCRKGYRYTFGKRP